MSEIIEEAKKKVNDEHGAYKKKIQKKEASDIYNNALNIIFTEGTAYYASQLIDSSESLAQLVLVEGKTLEKCTEHVIQYARKVCGGMGGDLPTGEFHKAIWEYYRMPVEVASTAIDKAAKERKKRMEESSKKRAEEAAAKKAADKVKKQAEKDKESRQVTIFDLFNNNNN